MQWLLFRDAKKMLCIQYNICRSYSCPMKSKETNMNDFLLVYDKRGTSISSEAVSNIRKKRVDKETKNVD